MPMSYAILTIKHRKFVDAYITNGGSATNAYLEAGYKCKRETATTNGYKLIQNEGIRKAIAERIKPDELKRKITINKIMENVRSMAEGEIRIAKWEGEDNIKTRRRGTNSRPPASI